MNITVDVMTPDGSVPGPLVAWLRKHGITHNIVHYRYGPITGRNQSVKAFLESDGDYLLQIDHDTVPDDDTEAILTAPGDLVYCGQAITPGLKAHLGDGNLCMGACRMSRGLLEKIQPPWFLHTLNADGTKLTKCDCRYFRDKARDVGIESRMVGLCGHLIFMVAKTDEHGHVKYRRPGPYANRIRPTVQLQEPQQQDAGCPSPRPS